MNIDSDIQTTTNGYVEEMISRGSNADMKSDEGTKFKSIMEIHRKTQRRFFRRFLSMS